MMDIIDQHFHANLTPLPLARVRAEAVATFTLHHGNDGFNPPALPQKSIETSTPNLVNFAGMYDPSGYRLDHRWFIGYDLDESVPDHSSLSKIRARYGLQMAEDNLTLMERKLLAALQERPDWLNHTQFANALGILQLSSIHVKLLRQLEHRGLIEIRQRRTTIGSVA